MFWDSGIRIDEVYRIAKRSHDSCGKPSFYDGIQGKCMMGIFTCMIEIFRMHDGNFPHAYKRAHYSLQNQLYLIQLYVSISNINI